MVAMASQITSLTIVYSTVYSDADKRKHQSSASLAFVRGIHRWPVNSLHKWPVTRKMFPIDDVIMFSSNTHRFTRSQCFHVVFLSCWNPWFRNCYHCNMANAIKTHLPLLPHICVSELDQHCFRQWLVAYSAPNHYLNQFYLLPIGTLGTNSSEILIKIQSFSFTKMHLKISSEKWRPFYPGVDELINY